MLGLVRPFYSIFDSLPDHRRAQGKRHSLVAVFAVVTLALINQQNSLRQIAKWAEGLSWQDRKRLPLRHNRVPSHSTILCVLGGMDGWMVANAVQAWVEEVLAAYLPTSEWQGLAIDGKTLRGSRDASEDSPALELPRLASGGDETNKYMILGFRAICPAAARAATVPHRSRQSYTKPGKLSMEGNL